MGEVSLGRPQAVRPFRSPPGYFMAGMMMVLMLSAAACPRRAADLSAPEVTYVAAGQSLVHDFDLQYDERDHTRLREMDWSEKDLLLRSSVTDARVFDVSGVYPILLAHVVWLAPLRGPVLINTLLLVVLALAAAGRLSQRLGRDAYVVISVCLFASVMYRSVFLVQPTIMMAAIVGLAFGLVFRHEEPADHGVRDVYRPPERVAGSGLRGLVIGVLLGLVAVYHPSYLLLAIPAAVVAPPDRRRSRVAGLAGGLFIVLGVSALSGALWGVPVSGWVDSLTAQLSGFDVGLTTWNLMYVSVGRNVGILPYFLPFLALLGLWKGGSGRSTLVVTVIAGSLIYLLVSPFDIFGGPAAVGNAWLIPWFVALWFVPTGPLPRGWLVATVLLAVPAMYPTWLAPSVEPVTSEGVYRHAAGRLHRLLPLETTQESLPPGEIMGSRFFVRSMSTEARVSGSSRWILEGSDWAVMHLATPIELAAVHLQFGPQAEAQLEVRGADLGDMVLTPEGGVGFRLENLQRKALHPMWWSAEKHFNYVLQFRMPMEEARSQTLGITGIAADLESEKP